jgi:hypothetical protein
VCECESVCVCECELCVCDLDAIVKVQRRYFPLILFYDHPPPQPPIKRVPEFFPTGKAARGYEVGHSSPSSAKVKNEWSFTFTSAVCLYGVDRENFTFLYIHVGIIF